MYVRNCPVIFYDNIGLSESEPKLYLWDNRGRDENIDTIIAPYDINYVTGKVELGEISTPKSTFGGYEFGYEWKNKRILKQNAREVILDAYLVISNQSVSVSSTSPSVGGKGGVSVPGHDSNVTVEGSYTSGSEKRDETIQPTRLEAKIVYKRSCVSRKTEVIIQKDGISNKIMPRSGWFERHLCLHLSVKGFGELDGKPADCPN